MTKAPRLAPREDGAQWMARLISAALMDEVGEALDGVAKTVDTLSSKTLSTRPASNGHCERSKTIQIVGRPSFSGLLPSLRSSQ